MTAISRSAVKLWLVAADTNPSTLSTSVWTTSNTTGYIPGVIKEYSVSGGDADVTSDPVFGGFVDKETPRSQYEVSLTVVPGIEQSLFDFHALTLARDASDSTVFTSAGVGSDQAFFIQANTGSVYKSWGMNNCNVTMDEITHSADDNMEQNITLKFSPTTAAGKPNLQYKPVILASLLDWSALSA